MLTNRDDVECYYSSNVAYYDYLYHDHLASSEMLLESLLLQPPLQNSSIVSVLDACCGSGHDVELLVRHGFNVDASDLCQEMIDYTQRRVRKFNTQSRFFQSDVLELESRVQGMYDLVLFRGNTLGHLRAPDQLRAVRQLYGKTKPGKFLLLDFRDGRRYHAEQKGFELRGSGIDRINHLAYFSFYQIKHAIDFTGTYEINSTVVLFDYRTLKFTRKSQRIEGHYVDVKLLVDLLSSMGCSYEFVETYGEGLPYLKTVLIQKAG
jgi:SAM-dependent methyltransferase